MEYINNMRDYIKNNSKRCNNINKKKCSSQKFQSYGPLTFGEVITIKSPISCNVQAICSKNQYKFSQYVLNQQNTYALMRRRPELFGLIPWVSNNGLTPAEQKQYSMLFWRQLGTSNSLPVNDVWSGTFIPGSETPYTN